MDLELVADRRAQLGKAGDIFVGPGVLTVLFTEHDLVVDQVEQGLRLVPQLGVTAQVLLDQHTLALPPADALVGQDLLLSIRAQCPGTLQGRRPGAAGGRNWSAGGGVLVGAHASEVGGQLGVIELGQPLTGRVADADGGEALLGIAAVHLEVLGDQRLKQRAVIVVENALVAEDRGHRPLAAARPGGESGESAPWSIRPFWRASRPKRRSRGVSALPIMGRTPNPGGPSQRTMATRRQPIILDGIAARIIGHDKRTDQSGTDASGGFWCRSNRLRSRLPQGTSTGRTKRASTVRPITRAKPS